MDPCLYDRLVGSVHLVKQTCVPLAVDVPVLHSMRYIGRLIKCSIVVALLDLRRRQETLVAEISWNAFIWISSKAPSSLSNISVAKTN
jgi:hypothetical protein